jgi:hypothetical protein
MGWWRLSESALCRGQPDRLVQHPILQPCVTFNGAFSRNNTYSAEGTAEYTTCANLLTTSSTTWPQTAVFQIGASGVPLSKIVIGKPAGTGDGNSGFMDAATLATCVAQAKTQGWSEPAVLFPERSLTQPLQPVVRWFGNGQMLLRRG